MRIQSDYLHSHFVRAVSFIFRRHRDIVQGNLGAEKCICISFDCDYEEDMAACKPLIDFLKHKEVEASFALVGNLAKRFPNAVEGILDEKMEILNHTLSHFSNFRSLPADVIQREIEGFQEIMTKTYNYVPKGFRCPHGLRKVSERVFKILREYRLYDSSLLGYNMKNIDGVLEIPLNPCPDHQHMAFDTYHHFHFPVFSSSEKRFLKLWNILLQRNSLVNVFLDPRDLISETRLSMFKGMIESAKECCFQFNQMNKLAEEWQIVNTDTHPKSNY